ncbi:hypothetical protein T07_4024 [Trichinella nelsoni]|uniref:Uncharacterized protein n=1 Tax=Trichinella nelsoni TaxID=6336 RepID=A0A0V0RY72_9BILA|nr:hypothetical protein T07_4024 [Trichinella nelsoni]
MKPPYYKKLLQQMQKFITMDYTFAIKELLCRYRSNPVLVEVHINIKCYGFTADATPYWLPFGIVAFPACIYVAWRMEMTIETVKLTDYIMHDSIEDSVKRSVSLKIARNDAEDVQVSLGQNVANFDQGSLSGSSLSP